MNPLTVIAMAEELRHWFAFELHFDGTAKTFNRGVHLEFRGSNLTPNVI
jgi:hypothetical protein